jgi:hypothetical protein
MRRFLIVIVLFILSGIAVMAQKSQVWMIGPMLHFNISHKVMHTSFGVELSWWDYSHWPYSFDAGFEFEKKKIRIYSEAQTGIGFLGLSFGPALEYRTDENKLTFGPQGSVWANYFGGFDLRFRKTGGDFSLCPGLYFKLPLGAGIDGDSEHHHWDWDD